MERTDEMGAFSSLQLDVGVYEILVEKAGFRAYRVRQVRVRSGQVAKFTAVLQVGLQSDSVIVQAGAGNYLDSADAQVSTSAFDPATIQYLPLENLSGNPLGRDPVALAQLVPGVVPNSSTLESGNFNADGQRGRSNNIPVDNAIATDAVTGEQAGTGTFTLESVQEITVMTGGLAAEFGRNSGSQVQIITRGGTNDFHGAAFWFTQNAALDAKNFFSPRTVPFSENTWGGSVGGPIIKNRVFFTADYQGVRASGESGSQVASVLTSAQASAITDPTSLSLFNAVGAPQSATGTQSNTSANDLEAEYSWSVRLDENLPGGKDIFTERYSTSPVTETTPPLTFLTSTLPNYGAQGKGLNQFVNLGYTHTFNPNLINQARFQFARTGDAFAPFTTLASPYAPIVDIAGFPLMGVSANLPQSRVDNIFQYSDALSWVHGPHAFKFGGDVYHYQVDSVLNDFGRGEFRYASVPAFQAGIPSLYIQGFGNPERNLRASDVDLFAQDDFRITRTLTLNFGVRLESSGGVTEADNIMANLNENSQAPLTAGKAGRAPSVPFN